jgi:hypothetical protein
MMRRLGVLCAFLLAACAGMGGGGGVSENVTLNVPGAPDSVLRLAVTQLQHHGYTVTQAGDGMIITLPKPVPNYLIETSNPAPAKGRGQQSAAQASQQWVLRVQTEKIFLASGTRLRVAGFIVPQAVRLTSGNAVQQTAIPITSENRRLFREVEVVAQWISDAATRRPKRG